MYNLSFSAWPFLFLALITLSGTFRYTLRYSFLFWDSPVSSDGLGSNPDNNMRSLTGLQELLVMCL